MTSITGIILSAGKGRRMQPYTRAVPKCLLEINGQPLLNYQIAAMRRVGINRIVIVRGHGRDLFTRVDVIYRDNLEYSSTDMVWSLLCAKDCFTGPIVISYGDILYDHCILQALLEAPADVSIVTDTDWRNYWELRFDDPLADAESLKLDSCGFVLDIGRRPVTYDEIEGQYIGLVGMTEHGVKQFLDACSQIAGEGTDDESPLRRVQMTTVLQWMVVTGIPVLSIPTRGGWVELDHTRDFESTALRNRLLTIIHSI